ncbi:Fic family protein [Bacteriovorax sp. DB6_IX]|uniref:Fic family protein n=1 Tax=Bacteriovorax sp. DB6_IX TaxID=1353530 RepID=UPI00038A5567|nr:Fic family protein [Bacteriovorax sp. DB6_IX]EQC52344.1 Fic/DOC family protein [Bacteriovorax sp. DB6_IX]
MTDQNKKTIQSSQEIIQFLEDFSYLDNEKEKKDIDNLIQHIEKSRHELMQKSVSMMKLSHFRILSSNSLKRKEGLKSWDNANKHIFQHIANRQEINRESINEINQILTDSETRPRTEEIYTGEWKYLEHKHLEECWKSFQKQVLSKEHSILRSCEIYIWLVTMHPFTNGNGRTSRICADWSLLEQSYLPLCFDSSVSSHVALTIGNGKRKKVNSIVKTLRGILRAYEICLN